MALTGNMLISTFVLLSMTHIDEVDASLLADLQALSPDDAHWVLCDLQHRPRFIHRVTSSSTSLDLHATIVINDSQEFQVTALLDSGCTGSSIDQAFVLEKGMNTHKLPQPILVYNVDGTHNSAGRIKEFIVVELKFQDHSEQIALAVTNLGTNTIFLGHDWLRLHNPLIDWKQGTVVFQCQDDHVPDLIDVDDDDDEEEQIQFQSSDQLFQLDVDMWIRNMSTDIVAAMNQQKVKKSFKEAVPHHYHDYEDVFAKENFDELPPCQP